MKLGGRFCSEFFGCNVGRHWNLFPDDLFSSYQLYGRDLNGTLTCGGSYVVSPSDAEGDRSWVICKDGINV